MSGVWQADATANCLNATYITDFLDISGGNLNIRTPYNLVTTTGSVNFNRNTTLAKPYTNDISLNGRLFVGGDVSMGDISLNINGNLSIAGTLSVGTYKTSSISLSAIASAGGGGGGGYTVNANDTTFALDMSYNNKIQMNNDVSLNAKTNATTLKVNGNIMFSDGSTINSYNDNLDISGGLTASTTGIAIDARTSNYLKPGVSYIGDIIIYPVNGTAGAKISRDYGTSFTQYNASDNCYITGVSGNGLCMCMISTQGLRMSTDGGFTWSPLNATYAITNTAPNGKSIGLSYTGQYIAFIKESANAYVYISSDYGVSWTSVLIGTNNYFKVAVSGNGKYIYISRDGAEGSLSSNYGASFTSTSSPNLFGRFSRDSCISHSGQYIANSNLYSNDYGATWQGFLNASSQLILSSGGTVTFGDNIWAVTCTPTGHYKYITGKRNESFCSINNGATWISLGTPMVFNSGDGSQGIAANSIGNILFYIHSTQLRRVVIPFKTSTFTNMTVIGSFASNPSVSSDYRIKTNVQTLDETDVLDKLRPVTYYQTQIARKDIGFIAHELEEHYPELVDGEKDGDKMQSVNYNGILALLINEVQRLKQDIKETKAVIAAKKIVA